MSKTKQHGYYEFAGKWMHFSMNCWANLKEDTGYTIDTWVEDYSKEDTIGQYMMLSDLAFAAFKANDQEDGNEIDYNIFNVRTWMEQVTPEAIANFVDAMSYSVGAPVEKK